MKAAIFEAFQQPLQLCELPDPVPGPDSVVLEIEATGVCRSDWHAWMGHDPMIKLPHVPGHELAGTVQSVGSGVSSFQVGDRVTVPFACGCGHCRYCQDGHLHLCDAEFQPGFTHWGSFAELVEIHYAEHNLVRLPDSLDFITAASLGCRFATAYRAVIQQGQLQQDQTLAVHGCGGLGLSALMIAKSIDAAVVAVDISADKLKFAQALGADYVINAAEVKDVAKEIRGLTNGGADVSIDAVGTKNTAWNSIRSLRKQGKHIQAGLLLGDDANPPLPTGRIISCELQIFGTHGMSARSYPDLLELVGSGRLDPKQLVTGRIPLQAAGDTLRSMSDFGTSGVVVIDRF